MDFAERITQSYRQTYRDQAMLAADHHQPVLRPYVSEQTCEGTQSAPALFYDSKKAKRRQGRVPGNRDNPTNRRRRWLKYTGIFDDGEYIDSEDIFKGMQNFQSPTMEAIAGAMQRFVDEDVILDGIFGDAYEGEMGETVKPFLSSQVIPATVQEGAGTAATGLNLQKLRNNRKLYASHKFNLQSEPIMIAVTAEQIDDLGDELKLTSKDYKDEAAPVFNATGKLAMVWNHMFIEYQNLTDKQVDYGAGLVTVQRVPTWRKSSVRLGVWKEITPRDTIDSSKYDAPYFWSESSMDCRRLEDTGVSEIECLIG
ncbi:phage capsid protein [Roseobacter sp.]|uniref:phage capsid protein n=1 Tax=Roseobacter sp. TaxID=1907202 RepID=UPI0029668B00|nr:phage capsid protein [Roseobacter sp.]MDW3181771.1 phage capsid protein [Roseobacter sp.]